MSVDVFDTLLLRTSTPELVKFYKLAERQSARVGRTPAGRVSAAELLRLRLLAAQAAYRNSPLTHGAREPQIDDILGVVVDHLIDVRAVRDADRAATIGAFVELELAIESDDLSLNGELAAILGSARARGLPVVAISDMYLRCEHVSGLIDGAGGESLLTDVFVSSEFGFGKASGALFRVVLEHLGVGGSSLVHLGDNRHSDCRVAASEGLRAFHLPRSPAWHVVRGARLRRFMSRMESGRV